MEILRFLRFDVKTDRRQRLQHDKFGLVSHIWNLLLKTAECHLIHMKI